MIRLGNAFLSIFVLFALFAMGKSLHLLRTTNEYQISADINSKRRRSLFAALGFNTVATNIWLEDAHAKSYSANARNLERMNTGDMSGGSVYNNNPKSDAGKRRRAMTGCKNSVAREEAAKIVLKTRDLSEKSCNQMVMEGNSEFMLQALRNLDCPSCPFGITGTREGS